MARTVYFGGLPGADYYAKKSPLVETPWSSGVVALNEGVAGEYSAEIPDDPHWVFRQGGDDPASDDIRVAQFGGAAPASGIQVGQTYRWRNVNHGQNYDDVRIEELP